MIQGSQITALLKMAGEWSDRPGELSDDSNASEPGAAVTGTLQLESRVKGLFKNL